MEYDGKLYVDGEEYWLLRDLIDERRQANEQRKIKQTKAKSTMVRRYKPAFR